MIKAGKVQIIGVYKGVNTLLPSKKEYSQLVKKASPNSKTGVNMLKAFLSGGIICCIGQAVLNGWTAAGLGETEAGAATSITLVLLGVLLTAVQVYDKIAKFAGAGTLVPITGFANSVASPAIEFKSEGFITGLAAKMFTIAGPVIVYGVSASVVYGLIYWVFWTL